MNHQVDVAIIGAGHAGLNAIKEIGQVTDNYVLINRGGLGTTCARIGCMPSKVAIHLAEVEPEGEGVSVRVGEHELWVEKVFAATGRHPNLARLGLERTGCQLDQHGIPLHDMRTLQVGHLPIYLAGDARGGIANLQIAAEQGRIAGYNTSHERLRQIPARTPTTIVFTDPNIAMVGLCWSDLHQLAKKIEPQNTQVSWPDRCVPFPWRQGTAVAD